MRDLLKHCLLSAMCLIAFVGCGKPMTGTLKIAANQTVSVQNFFGSETVLRDGPASVKIDGDNLGSTRTITIENQGNKTKLKVPDTALLSTFDLKASAQEIGQDFDLRATKRRHWLGTSKKVNGSASCTYSGVCSTCGLGFDGKITCGPNFSAMCFGTQPAVLLTQNYREVTSIFFTRHNKTVAVFTSDAPIEVASEVVSTTGPCQ